MGSTQSTFGWKKDKAKKGKSEKMQERILERMNTEEPDDCAMVREFEVQLWINHPLTNKNQRLTYAYTVITPTGVMFVGDSFCPSPGADMSKRIFDELIFWVCLRPGDTDEEFFQDYTPEQLAWAQSWECEVAQSELPEDI